MSRALFITGTGTDVGKTYVSGLILKALHAHGMRAAYFKAAMSGNDRRADGTLLPGDASFVKTISGIPQPLETMCPYVYEAAVSPHLAAKLEGNPVELERVVEAYQALEADYEYITMEGSGGILCPLRQDDTAKLSLEDVIRRLHLSCLVVADAGLGTINSVVLTCAYLKAQQIPVKGIVFNRFHPGNVLEEDNLRMCEELTGHKVIACIPPDATELELDAAWLASLYE